MNIFICEIAHQYRLDAWYKIFPAGALDDPEGRYEEGGVKVFQGREYDYT